MCGIFGIASSRPLDPATPLAAIRDTLAHRGPDGAGTWWSADRRVALAHRRLAIIDLSEAAGQPMSDVSGNLTIVFNGEIYNFRELRERLKVSGYPFRTNSDTEVVLNAFRKWGDRCIEQLNGMFSFCIHDACRGRLFLARDRAGEKPLFYSIHDGRLMFASELKALMKAPGFPRQVEHSALESYLAYGYVPGQDCILAGVRKLGAGCRMSYELATGRLQTQRYWQLPTETAKDTATEDQLLDELEALLEDSVRRQLVADVPVGVLLSGGLDSSLVTAMAARVSTRPVKTFTISFPGHGHHDESNHARLVADHFGTQHTELAAEPASADLLPELACQYDEPLADSSLLPTFLVSRLIRSGAAVALGGDGADELFGGYPHHRWMQQWDLLATFVPDLLRGAFKPAIEMLPTGARGRNYLLAMLSDVYGALSQFNLLFDSASRRRLLSPCKPCQSVGGLLQKRDWLGSRRSVPVPFSWNQSDAGRDLQLSPEDYKKSLAKSFTTPLRRATAVDFLTYLTDDILVKVDRASMLSSLEVRAPWLDQRIVDFAFRRLPDRLRSDRHTGKILPRRLARRLLPSEFDLRRKQGFSLPLSDWFRGPWGDYVEEVVRGLPQEVFAPREVERLIAGQRRGRNNVHRLFALTMLELWRREYDVSFEPGFNVIESPKETRRAA